MLSPLTANYNNIIAYSQYVSGSCMHHHRLQPHNIVQRMQLALSLF